LDLSESMDGHSILPSHGSFSVNSGDWSAFSDGRDCGQSFSLLALEVCDISIIYSSSHNHLCLVLEQFCWPCLPIQLFAGGCDLLCFSNAILWFRTVQNHLFSGIESFYDTFARFFGLQRSIAVESSYISSKKSNPSWIEVSHYFTGSICCAVREGPQYIISQKREPPDKQHFYRIRWSKDDPRLCTPDPSVVGSQELKQLTKQS
jgi:hypothetical protein